MAVLPILTAPDPRLKKICTHVDTVDDDIRALMDDMLETMYAAPGIGLAAPQVGINKRVIVVDVAHDDQDPAPLAMANPEIIAESPELVASEEGCLSLPEHYSDVTRPAHVTVRYLDKDNEIREIEAHDLLSTCVQHEMDHLDGILFVDHISSIKRNMIIRKLKKTKKAEAEA